MRIVHIATNNEHLCGIEQHVLNLAGAQQARGDSLLIVASQPGDFPVSSERRGLQTVILKGLEAGIEPWERQARKTIESLISQLTNFGPDLIHCHTHVAVLKAAPAANKMEIPCVYTHHALGPINLLPVVKDWGFKFSIITVSKIGMEAMRKSGALDDELYYVPNGTDVVPRGTRQPRRPDLIFAGRLEFVKGIDIAILAMAKLRQLRGQDCPALNIYGDGAAGRYANEMVSVLRLDDIVRFHGTRPGILEQCADTDILIVPSRQESGPLVVLEAMSRGIPVVASRVGQLPDMLPDERYGRVVPVGSIVAFAEAIESLLADIENGKFDPELLITRHQANFTSGIMAERIWAVYERLVSHGTLV